MLCIGVGIIDIYLKLLYFEKYMHSSSSHKLVMIIPLKGVELEVNWGLTYRKGDFWASMGTSGFSL